MIRLIAALAASAALVGAPALAAPALQVSEPWSRPAAAGGSGAGFLTLANTGPAADALVAAESPVAQRVEIHRSSIGADGVASMQRLQQVALAPGQTVRFAPGGYHLMFRGLTQALKPGDAVPVTMVFQSGARATASFKVQAAAPSGGAHRGH